MRKLILSLLVFVATMASAQMMPPVAPDAAYRIGKLDNGLTYYIRHNEYPANVANFYIAQRVGSIQEEDSQRGLAHFLEHMAFNGSTHFPNDGLLNYTRNIGVAFGKDLNAYTSIEQTVYNIDNVPTTRQSALDSCLLILQDWSNGLTLSSEEIDKERGVIHGEWAMRNSATQRLFERSLPLMYPNNRYGYRMPIGTMEVVDNFKPEELRAYYRKWYHPENQAIIVIGNVDVDYTEAKIKELFSDIKAGPEAAHVTPLEVENNKDAIIIFDKDKEMQYSLFSVMLKSDPLPKEMRGTLMEYMQGYLTSMISNMFNSRMSELSQEPDCPFIQLSMSYGNYCLSSTKDAFDITVVAKEGKEKECIETLIREVKRAKQFGFTGSEFVRAKEEFLSSAEKAYTNRDKRKNTEYYNQCVNNFLEGNAMADAETHYQNWKMVTSNIPLQVINQLAGEALSIDNDSNFVCFEFAQEKEGATYHTTADIKAIIDAARAETLTAWVDNAKDEPLIAQLPKAGKIKKETKNDVLGYTELVLSNGAKVILKKTDFKDDQVIMSAFQPGGKSLYGAADYSNLKFISDVWNTCGLGNFTNNELEKALAGKQVGLGLSLGNRFDNISGQSTPKDLETLFQLLYLHFTALNKDEKAYTSFIQQSETALKNRNLRPETELTDSVIANLYDHNSRFYNITVEDIPHVSLDRCMEIAKARYATANNFTFTFIGNFDEAVIRQLVCQYIASLPGKGKVSKTKDIRTVFNKNIDCQFTRKMETPKPYVIQVYYGNGEYNLESSVLAKYVSEVLSMKLLKTVREDYGAAYTVSGSAFLNTQPEKTYAMLEVAAPISVPEKLDSAILLMNQGVEELAVKADPDMVSKVKTNLLKQADVDAKLNGHWQNVIETYLIRGIDLQTRYKEFAESVTPEMISNFLREKIINGKKLNVVMRPE